MRIWLMSLTVVALFAFVTVAHADPIFRDDAVPAGLGIGDMWSFKCPSGGSFNLFVDTSSGLMDPLFQVFDKDGNSLVYADDSTPCSNACANSCPQALAIPCASGNLAYIVVRNFGTGSPTCPGGAYQMTLEVFDKNFNSLDAKKVRLGGGARQKVPAFADPNKLLQQAPLVNDGEVP